MVSISVAICCTNGLEGSMAPFISAYGFIPKPSSLVPFATSAKVSTGPDVGEGRETHLGVVMYSRQRCRHTGLEAGPLQLGIPVVSRRDPRALSTTNRTFRGL